MRNQALKIAVQIVILALSVLLLGSWDNVDWSKITVTALKPGNKIGTFESSVELSWGLIPGADRYEVQSSTTLQDLAISPASEVKAGTFFTLTSMDENKIDEIWYWRVRAINNTGEATAWSTTRQVVLNMGGVISVGTTGPAGGIVFYDKGSYSDGWRYLEAATSDLPFVIRWGDEGTRIGTSRSIGAGKANTQYIVAAFGMRGYAARRCYDYTQSGYDDWFLPSKDELNELYKQKEAVGGFSSIYYWSSSENDSNNAWRQYFGSGSQNDYYRYFEGRVRAVRAF